MSERIYRGGRIQVTRFHGGSHGRCYDIGVYGDDGTANFTIRERDVETLAAAVEAIRRDLKARNDHGGTQGGLL